MPSRNQPWRDRVMPAGAQVSVHDGTRALVDGEVVDNTGVLIVVRLTDGREVCKYDHEVFAREADT